MPSLFKVLPTHYRVMLKRIPVSALKKGMYVQELCGSWMEHPFWRSSFPIANDKELKQILDSGIKEAWIDTLAGLDVEFGQTREELDEQIEQQLLESAIYDGAESNIASVSMAEELKRAAAICAKAKRAVSSMFQEARMGKAIDFEHALPMVEEISGSVLRHSGALISLVRLKQRNEYSYMHSVAVCALMVALARQLGLSEEQILQAGLGGLLHDLGKARIPLEILDKPGKLTEEEFQVIKSHPELGHQMLMAGNDAGQFMSDDGLRDGVSSSAGEIALEVCLHHHEKTDGSGYPHQLKAPEISLFARMGAVCDVYDAITSNRPYKSGWDPAESLRKMAEWSKGHFDEKVFQAFVKVMGIYPIGSLVRLESGRLGVVTEQNSNSLLLPRVRVFFSTQSGAHIAPELIDLALMPDRIAGRESAAKWGFQDLSSLWTEDVLRVG
jgi:putative nucleotidyltransferase with HDIG domain